MTDVSIRSGIKCATAEGVLLREVLDICAAGFFKQKGRKVSPQLARNFPPTRRGQPSSGLEDFLYPQGLGTGDAEVCHPNAECVFHAANLGEFILKATRTDRKPLFKVVSAVCRDSLPLAITHTPLDEDGTPQAELASCTLIEKDGATEWSISDLMLLEATSSDAKVKKAMELLAVGRAILDRGKDDSVLTNAVNSDLDQQAWVTGYQALMRDLCSGRHNLPLRIFKGYVHSRQPVVVVDSLLTYSDHVAVLGLFASGIDQNLAARQVASGAAGAFAGNRAAFPAWAREVETDPEALLGSTLPDGSEWIIWRADLPVDENIVPAVVGWDQANDEPIPFAQRFGSPDMLTIH